MNSKVTCGCIIAALLGGAAVLSVHAFAPPGPRVEKGNGGGRLSPASLDLDTCGCPTMFDDPVCEQRTSWTLDKTTDTDKLQDPVVAPYLFDITVTEGPTETTLIATGMMVVTNSGDQAASLESVAVLLEKLTPGAGNAPGPSGKNWTVLLAPSQARSPACGDTAVTCHGSFGPDPNATLVLFDCDDVNDIIALVDVPAVEPSLDDDNDGLRDEDPPLPDDPSKITGGCAVIDNDGDGLFDEDPIDGIDNDNDGLIDEDGPDDDGDGLVDEDGPCDDNALIICFEVVFDISGLGINGPGDGVVPSADDLRLDLVATFKAGGRRGGTCSVDVDCDGVLEDGKGGRPDEGEGYVRTIQQRLRFDPPECTPVCDCVQLTDTGASAKDEDCVLVTTDTLDEQICSAGEGTVTNRTISGTVTCINGECSTTVNNTAELTCEDPDLISGSPNGASFDVNCGPPEPPDEDFCTQTQGGWGSTPSGNNPGACLHDSFAAVFPSGIVIGDSDGPDADACWAILLTDAQAVTDFLPTGGTPATLTADLIDPLVSSAGVFAGQLVAATINVAFSASAETCPGRDFPAGLGDLVYNAGCVDADLVGLSVNQVIAISNGVISGCSAPPAGVTISDLNDALSVLNENFVDCDTDEGCLDSPP